MIKKKYEEFKDTMFCIGCDTPEGCKGCYQEYLNDNEEIQPDIYKLVVKYYKDAIGVNYQRL